MQMWGTVAGRARLEVERDPGESTSRYGGSDWWRDCGDEAALLRHVERGQAPCLICVEGERRRRQEAQEARTGVPLTEEALIRQLNGLNRGEAMRRRYAPKSPCGTEPARRRHRRWQETCSTCGIRDGRSGAPE
jgi:hypothetical protein